MSKTTKRKVSGSLTPVVLVKFEAERTQDQKDRRVLPGDNGEVGDFLRWCIDTETFSMSGYGMSGPGIYRGFFYPEDVPAVQAWLTDHGIEMSEDES
jgi:hypothetical protein